jgi:putative hydrolase of the HAD superfamily/pyrimidine and pyridine-specific 5'-nucleotidase
MDPSIPKYIFTASVRHHAERCLKALGIDDLFVDIIDVKSCNLETKHSPSSFEAAMRIASVTNPEACVFLDDSVRNICAARQVGWRSILVGRVSRDTGQPITATDAEAEIDTIHDFPEVLPELYSHL